MRRKILLVGSCLAILFAGACGNGNGSDSDGSTNAKAAPSTTAAEATTLHLATTSLGKIIVDRDGRTLYVFMKDSGGKSACEGQCAQLWPPLVQPASATVGAGLDASKLGTIQRGDGTSQVTYAGAPLYSYAKDGKAGDTNGQGVGSVWYVAGADGKPITAPASTATTTASTSSY